MLVDALGGLLQGYGAGVTLVQVQVQLLLPLLGVGCCSVQLPYRAVKRAEHRRAAGPKSSPCLSAANLGCVTVKVTMCPVDREAQGTDSASSHRIVSGEGAFWFLFGPSIRNSHAQRAKAVHLLCFPPFAALARFRLIREEQSFRAVRAAYFCLVKSKQNRHRRTLADAMKPHRSPALLA